MSKRLEYNKSSQYIEKIWYVLKLKAFCFKKYGKQSAQSKLSSSRTQSNWQRRSLRKRTLFSVLPKGKIFSFFLMNWWVVAFILMAIALYVEALYQKKQLTGLLRDKVSKLKEEKEIAIRDKEQLELRLKSEEDPEWILLVLKQKLGMVEEGEIKVIFSKRTL